MSQISTTQMYLEISNVTPICPPFRYGPHQGSFQLHCHDLGHEVVSLMVMFNSTSMSKPLIKGAAFQPGAGLSITREYAHVKVSPKKEYVGCLVGWLAGCGWGGWVGGLGWVGPSLPQRGCSVCYWL